MKLEQTGAVYKKVCERLVQVGADFARSGDFAALLAGMGGVIPPEKELRLPVVWYALGVTDELNKMEGNEPVFRQIVEEARSRGIEPRGEFGGGNRLRAVSCLEQILEQTGAGGGEIAGAEKL